jgi:chitodextrinase
MWEAAARCIRRRAFAFVALVAVAATLQASSAGAASKRIPSKTSAVTVTQATAASLAISWQRVRSAAGYDLYLNGAGAGKTQATSYTFANLRCGASYTLGVDAFTNKGVRSAVVSTVATTAACQVAPSASNTTSPSPPASLSQGATTTTSISLLWSASLDSVGVAGYDLFVNGTKVGTTAATSYTFANLSCGTSYTLAVDAYDTSGNRSQSAAVQASTSPCPDTSPPTIPGLPTQTGSTTTSISLLWSASLDSVGVAGYDLFVNGTKVGTTAATSYTFANLSCGTSYKLAVDAYDSAGNRSQLASLGATTTACPTPTSGSTTRDVYPGQSILAAIDASAPGDTVFVHAGSYPKLTLDKTFTGGKVHVVGEPGTVIAGVYFPSVGGYSFEKLTSRVPNATDSGFYIHGTSHDIDILNDTIRGGWDGIKVYAAYPDVASNILVRDSDVSGAAEDDFHIDGAQTMRIEHNFIHDPIDNSDHNDGVHSQRSDQLTITRNTFSFQSVAPYDGPNQGIILGANPTFPGRVTNTVISNNVIAHWNGGRPLILSGTTSTQVVNNTFVDDGPGANYASITLNAQFASSGSDFQNNDAEIWNNIVNKIYIDSGAAGPAFCDTNLVTNPQSGMSGTNVITADPQFIDRTTYALGSASPARGVALTRAGTPTLDIDGVLRSTPGDLGGRG